MSSRWKYLLAVTGDLHTNSTVGLVPGRFTLDDGGDYSPSRIQNWLRRKWHQYWEDVKLAQEKTGAELVIILNGELVDDNHHTTTQLVTRNKADQIRMAYDVLKPGLDLLDEDGDAFVTRGTEAHTGPNANLDEAIARDIDAVPSMYGNDGSPSAYSWWQLRVSFDGVLIDVAHHPGTGSRVQWTRGADANRLAAATVIQCADYGEPIPDLVIRGHNHIASDSYDNHRARAIIMPSWQLGTSFGFRLGGGWLKTGGMMVLCGGGRYRVIKRFHDWPIRPPVVY